MTALRSPFVRPLKVAGFLLAFLFSSGAVLPGQDKGAPWICPPCSVDCHDDSFDKPGSCAQCGMKLVPAHTVPHVGVLIFDGVDLMSMAIPAGIFQSSKSARVFTVADTTDPVRSQSFQTIVPQYRIAEAPRVDVLIIPGGRGIQSLVSDEIVLSWLKQKAGKARYLFSLDTGTWLLAKAGLLTDQEVAVPKFVLGPLKKDAPDARPTADRISSESGSLFTARNLAGAIEQSLDLLSLIADEKTARATATALGFTWQPDPDRAARRSPAPDKAPVREKSKPRENEESDSSGSERSPDAETSPVSKPKVEGTSYVGTDWPHWRGIGRDGVSPERGWLDHGAEEPLWTAELGLGHSCITVSEGRAYALGFDESSSSDHLRCLDAVTGEEIWRASFPGKLRDLGHSGGTLSTPALHDGRVYLTHREGGLRCLDAKDGTLIWERELAEELGLKGTDYGFGGSPLVVDGLVVYEVAAVVAVSAETGDVVWKTGDLMAMYSTPTAFEQNGQGRLAVFTKKGLYVLDRKTGAECGSYPFRKGRTTVNASTPVLVDDRLFISSGYNHGCAMLSLDDADPKPQWESRVMRTKLSGCVYHAGHLFGFDETTLKCIDLAGRECWRKRGLGMGALAASDGRLLLLSSRGELVVADASPTGYRERSRRKILSGGACWTTPVLARGRIYCRNSRGTLICLDHRPG